MDWCQQLYESKSAELVLYGRALGLSHGEAEDVLHDTFVKLMKRTESPRNPEFYCLRAYRNLALNFRRNFWRRIRNELESKRWFDQSGSIDCMEAASVKCLKELPVSQREVIVLKIWHRYTFEQIGTLLTLSPNTASGRYRCGIQKLRKCFETSNYEELRDFGASVELLETSPGLREA